MKKSVGLVLLLGVLHAYATEAPHVGYVYPAGGTPGSTFAVTIGGQYLKEAFEIHLSGGHVTAEITDYAYEVDPRAANRARRMKEEMEAALVDETDDQIREQIQYQIEQASAEMMMVQEMKMKMSEDKDLLAKKQFNPQLSETLTLQVTLDDDAEPGAHELRLVATNGLSNHLVFQVSELTEILEVEPNDELAELTGDAPTLPLLLNGQVLPGDIDWFRFFAESGKDLVFRVQARSLVPYLADAVPGWFQAVLALYDSEGKEIAYVDDFRFDPDPVLICQVPEDGEYVLKIRDSIYRGRRDFVYRIEMGELPFVDHIFPLGGQENRKVGVRFYGVNLSRNKWNVPTFGSAPEVRGVFIGEGKERSNSRPFYIDTIPSVFEKEMNDIPSQAQKIESSVVVDGRIGQPGDVDCFRFEGNRNHLMAIEVFARRLDSPLDARLVLLDSEEHILAISDDEVDRGSGLVTHHADSLLNVELPEDGVYTIRLEDLQGKGGHEYAYRLRVGREQPDYKLLVLPSSLSIPKDGNAVITVHALRKGGFDGAIELNIKSEKNGLELHHAVIPKGEDQTAITLSASGRHSNELMVLEIEGKAQLGMRTLRRLALPVDDVMQAFLYRHLVPAEELLVRVTPAEPMSVELDLPPDGFMEASPGEQLTLLMNATAEDDVKGYIRVELVNPPVWITQKTWGINSRSGRVQKMTFEISPDAPVGAFEILILKGSFAIKIAEDDPTYNPLKKWVNRTKYEFIIGAIPVKITD